MNRKNYIGSGNKMRIKIIIMKLSKTKDEQKKEGGDAQREIDK